METLEPNVTHELVGDLRALADEAATALADVVSGKPTDDAVATLRAQFEVAQAHFDELCGQAKQQVKEAGDYADQAVRDNPYRAVAIVAGVGVVIGLLLSRVSRK